MWINGWLSMNIQTFINTVVHSLSNGKNKVIRTTKRDSRTGGRTESKEKGIQAEVTVRAGTADNRRTRIRILARKRSILQSERGTKNTEKSINPLLSFFLYNPQILFVILYIDSMFADEMIAYNMIQLNVIWNDIQTIINGGVVG